MWNLCWLEITPIDLKLHQLTWNYTNWLEIIPIDFKFTNWLEITPIDLKLHQLTWNYTNWLEITPIDLKLHQLILNYTNWLEITPIDLKLHQLTWNYTNWLEIRPCPSDLFQESLKLSAVNWMNLPHGIIALMPSKSASLNQTLNFLVKEILSTNHYEILPTFQWIGICKCILYFSTIAMRFVSSKRNSACLTIIAAKFREYSWHFHGRK